MSKRLLQFGGLLVLSAGLSTAGPYFSENFDLVSQGLYNVSGSAIGKFFLTGGSIDLVGGSYFAGLCNGNATGHCVDLNGENPGTLTSQPFNLPAGSFYLSFVLNGTGASRPLLNPDTASARITMSSAGNTFFDALFTLHHTDLPGVWQEAISVPTVLAGSGVTIRIASANPVDVPADPMAAATGLILDSVTVTDAALPEPATIFGGLLIVPLAWVARKRKKA